MSKKESNTFSSALKRAGLYKPWLAANCVRVLLSLRNAPMTKSGRLEFISQTGGSNPLGPLIASGCVEHVLDEQHYIITPSGETWLTAIEKLGLLAGPEFSQAAAHNTGGAV